jgi:hypothetical protein
MGKIDPEVLQAVIVTLVALTVLVCTLINTIRNGRRNPSVDTDMASMKTKIESVQASQLAVAEALAEKQSITACNCRFADLGGNIRRVEQRQSDHEDKISRQVGGIHERINTVLSAVSELKGIIKGAKNES